LYDKIINYCKLKLFCFFFNLFLFIILVSIKVVHLRAILWAPSKETSVKYNSKIHNILMRGLQSLLNTVKLFKKAYWQKVFIYLWRISSYFTPNFMRLYHLLATLIWKISCLPFKSEWVSMISWNFRNSRLKSSKHCRIISNSRVKNTKIILKASC